jgi:hypothetical protein
MVLDCCWGSNLVSSAGAPTAAGAARDSGEGCADSGEGGEAGRVPLHLLLDDILLGRELLAGAEHLVFCVLGLIVEVVGLDELLIGEVAEGERAEDVLVGA